MYFAENCGNINLLSIVLKCFWNSDTILSLLKEFNMTYENFLAAVTQSVQEAIGQEYRVLLHHVLKNNSTSMDGLSILKEGENASPTIYLNEFYNEFLNDKEIPQIADKVIKIYETHCKKVEFNIEEFKDYERIKRKLAVKLVNYEGNRTMLKELPHRKFLDLAVICYVLLGKAETETASILVRQEFRKMWKVSEEELFLQAITNAQQILPPELKSMDVLIRETLSKKDEPFWEEEQEGEVPMYVLTNTSRFNGAAAMLYTNVISDFAECMEADIYILPSSIHEVILIPKSSDIEKSVLEQMVREVNAEEVEQMEQLSNSVYCYHRKDGTFCL